jgi:hypothetical protein
MRPVIYVMLEKAWEEAAFVFGGGGRTPPTTGKEAQSFRFLGDELW